VRDEAAVAGVLLAAGAGSRFGGDGHKLVADLGGRPVYRWALDAVTASGLRTVFVVTGAVALDLGPRPAGPVTVVEVPNPRWVEGQSTSLVAAVEAAARHRFTAVVVGLADQPFVHPDTWRRLAAADAPIAVATYGGQRRNPVRLDREVWPLLPRRGDLGARDLLRLRPDLVSEIPCDGSAADIDTREDLHRWNS
jgi:CTP:molybdopterin cytidylyltransferase MocA